MSAPTRPGGGPRPPVAVAGGIGGIEARTDDLTALAGCVARAGVHVGEVTVEADLAGLALLDPVVAVLDPVGAAAATAALVGAVHGGSGVATVSARMLTLAAGVRAAAAAYAAAESTVTTELEGFVHGLLFLPGAVATGLAVTARTGSVTTGLQTVLDVDPQLVDAAVLTVGSGEPAGVAGVLAGLFPDGRARLTARPADPDADAAGPPRDVAGLVAGLDRRNHDDPGAIDVRVLSTVDPDGTVHRRAVVDVPGTKDWSLQRHNTDVTGLGSNLRALSGADSTYTDGVLAALAAAGVEPGTEVLFVGHSLGGMVALAAAGRARALGYRPAVVTVGSPLGGIAPPAGVPVLAVENATDVVPHLDGGPNPAGPDVVTVTVDHPHVAVGDNHGIDTSYEAGASDVDAATDPTVVAARARLTPFLGADSVETHVYVVSRQYP